MATLENNPDTIPCRHCGSPVRVGMIRCRECRGLIAEVEPDFVLSPQAAIPAQRTCARCGTPLEAGVDDCPNCASALLDELLQGPGQSTASPSSPQADMEWESAAADDPAARPMTPAARPAPEWTPLRELEPSNADSESGDATSAPAQPATRTQPTKPPGRKDGGPQQRRGTSPQKAAGASKSPATAKGRSSIEDDPPGLFDDDEVAPATPARPKSTSPAPAPSAAKEEPSSDASVETTAACSALLASLATADTNLRIEIAAALGKLGDKAALAPLERHLVDKEVRVRRAVAAALVQLGHPKGESLLEIAERKPVAPPP